MKVSAIIPAYNRRHYIRRAVDSILNQTVPVHEIIVVDDGSKDGTADLVEELYGSRVKLIRQANTGVAGARYRGIQSATGDWIAFLDSDDEWTPDRNSALLAAAAKVPEDVAWIFGDLRIVTDEGDGTTLFEEHGLQLEGPLTIFEDSLSVQFPFQFGMLQGSFIRTKALLETNCFSEGLRSDDDLLAGFQIACRYRFAAIPTIVGTYFRTSDLAAGSVVVNGVFGPDHFRSRMWAFGLVIENGRRHPWHLRYAEEVRGLGKVLARRGGFSRSLGFQQFRYGGVSAKGVGFLCAALIGARGVRTWERVAAERRKRMKSTDGAVQQGGLKGYFQSVIDQK
jgi:glycosyltransferase involved in cell wall biosynthesis